MANAAVLRVPANAPDTAWSIDKRNPPPTQLAGALSAQTLHAKAQTPVFQLRDIAQRFPLPWSVYVALLSLKTKQVRGLYQTEELRGDWSVRPLTGQIGSQFFDYRRVGFSPAP